jgi:hypothetical protein
MLLRLHRIAVVLRAAITLAATSNPSNADAHGFLFGPAFLGAAGWSRGPWGGAWGGGSFGTTPVGGGGSGCGCCCQVWIRRLRRRALAGAVGVAVARVAAVGNFDQKTGRRNKFLRSSADAPSAHL